jgi:hypothetical protein
LKPIETDEANAIRAWLRPLNAAYENVPDEHIGQIAFDGLNEMRNRGLISKKTWTTAVRGLLAALGLSEPADSLHALLDEAAASERRWRAEASLEREARMASERLVEKLIGERDEARSWHNAGTCPKCKPLIAKLKLTGSVEKALRALNDVGHTLQAEHDSGCMLKSTWDVFRANLAAADAALAFPPTFPPERE